MILALILVWSGTAGAASILVLNLDTDPYDANSPNATSSAATISQLLTGMGVAHTPAFVGRDDHTTLADSSYYAPYDLVFIGVGVNCVIQVAHVFNTDEGQALVDYLESGGMVYMEGGDVWYQDPEYNDGFDFGDAFRVNPRAEMGLADLDQLEGTGIANGLEFDYGGDNCFIDVINHRQGISFKVFENVNQYQEVSTVAVSYQSSAYKTIACSFEFNGLTDGTGNNTQEYLLGVYLDFFGIMAGILGDVNDDGQVDADDVLLLGNYLADNIAPALMNLGAADVDESGAINLLDKVILHNFVAGNISTLPFTP
ncbi:MAG: hypothetical protein JXQ27_13455 [Acidobacteria bacterium]|nr:hypothetical protein [Acidobacteriota bacterium]